jgi:uncharacterized peroxidase-related enzyme
MSFVALAKEGDAQGELKQRYQDIRSLFGFMPNYFLALGGDVPMIDAQNALYVATMGDGALPRTVKEQIGVVVSGLNTSSYCVALHMELLRQLGIEKPLSRKLATDWPHAPVDDKVRTLFQFADKLTRKTEEVEEADVEALRAAGWDDAAIRETVITVALFNFVNRVSIGLGVVADF